jgi:hypothetical protein
MWIGKGFGFEIKVIMGLGPSPIDLVGVQKFQWFLKHNQICR